MPGLKTVVKRGSAELAILAVLQGGPLHGYEIARQIERQTNGVLKFNLASLYPMLYSMEKRKWVQARWETGETGRRRRYYELTQVGKKQLVPLRQEWALLFQALSRLAGVVRA